MFRFSILCVLIAIGGCSKHQVKAKPVAAKPQKPMKKKAPPAESKTIVEASPNLGVTADIVDGCTVQIADLGKAPKFDYDDSDLLAEDRAVLDRIATCVVSGPLTGRKLQLVGRADPRGTQEYNMTLGNKRAKTVAMYLERVGVASQQITITTRGDLDALGKDESTWRGDRRVDMELLDGPAEN
jgi:peptidoglycan-associated lipoprotein